MNTSWWEIDSAADGSDDPPDSRETFEERQERAARAPTDKIERILRAMFESMSPGQQRDVLLRLKDEL